MLLLDLERYQSGWGVDGFCAWGGSDDTIHPAREVDHGVEARNSLVSQYRNQTNMPKLIAALAQLFQTLEDALQLVSNSKGLDGSGSALDGIADLFSMQRAGMADNTLRNLLHGMVMAAASDCAPDTIRAIADALMQGLQQVHLREDFPGNTILRTYELPQKDGELFASILANSPPPPPL